MEQHIKARNPELFAGALTVTTPGLEPALLIEPATPPNSTRTAPLTIAEQATLIENIWPSIAEYNRTTTPAHARIDKALILITTPDRPLTLNTSNGTTPSEQYSTELSTLRANAALGPTPAAGGDGPEADAAAPPPPDRASIAQLVQESVSAVTGWPHEDGEAHHRVPKGGTFFERGMDSLVALQLARVLRRGLFLRGCCGWPGAVGLSTVYCNPTVERLTEAVFVAVGGSGEEGAGGG